MQNVKVTRKGEKGPVAARVFILFARKSSTAVIFRRGPSKWVQLFRWDTKTDTFEPGQWFHGRIYERRSDLSPNGSLIIYFAQKIEGRTLKDSDYTYAWTAVSRPPYFTALALWPKGDCWHGGGLFEDDRTVILNHKPEVARPHPDHIARGIRVRLKTEVCGEDDPLFSERLERDGWNLKQKWVVENQGYPKMFLTRNPEIREKTSPDGSHLIRLTRSIETLDYAEEFAVSKSGQSKMTELDRASWADWDQRGRLVFARDGKVFAGHLSEDGPVLERELIDLNPSKPIALPAPDWASQW
ncbi:MAG TPA: hypothetical protein VFT65_05605 [Candidatus Angelobacter sp.]|nr:hypothetical protein [Candidatus Angelobacter sp.]